MFRKANDLFTGVVMRLREEAIRFHRGQTMVEYALILAAVAVTAYAAYQGLEGNIGSLLTTVGKSL